MARQYEPRGWLVKLSTGTLRKQWHRRYFVLSGNEIRYYKQENDVYPAGYINLQEYHYAHPESLKKMPFTFSILSKDRSKRPYVLYAENSQDMMMWIESLRTVFKSRELAIRKNASNTSAGTDEQEYNDSVLDKWLHRLDLDEPKHHQIGGREFESNDQISVSSSSQIENSLVHGSHNSRRSTESLASSVQSDSASSILSTSSSGTTDVTTPTSPSSRNSVVKQPIQQPQLQANQQDMSRNRVRTNRYGVKALHTSSVSHPVAMSSFLTQQPTVSSHMSSATNIEQNPFFNPRVPPRNRNRPTDHHRSPPSSPRSFIMRPDQILPAGSGKDFSWVLQDDGALGSNQKRASCPPIESIP